MKKAIIFGAGKVYREHATEYKEQYEIVGIVDNNYMNIKNVEVNSPNIIINIDYDYIIITPMVYDEIYNQLLEMGVEKKKIRIQSLCEDKYTHQYAHYHSGNIYYGQHADDLIIQAIFSRIGIEKPSYLDLGTNHPIDISNTAALYLNGCRGINVEANPALIRLIEMSRPEDVNLNVGVAKEEGVMTFYEWDNLSGLNTFVYDEVKRWNGHVPEKTIELQVTTLKKIIDNYCPTGFPDYLDCDIEGLDFEVLDSYDLKTNGPKVICVEVRCPEIEKFDKMLWEKDYYRFCRIGANNIYVKKQYCKQVSNCECDYMI